VPTLTRVVPQQDRTITLGQLVQEYIDLLFIQAERTGCRETALPAAVDVKTGVIIQRVPQVSKPDENAGLRRCVRPNLSPNLDGTVTLGCVPRRRSLSGCDRRRTTFYAALPPKSFTRYAGKRCADKRGETSIR
jgi:hypothetical protein